MALICGAVFIFQLRWLGSELFRVYVRCAMSVMLLCLMFTGSVRNVDLPFVSIASECEVSSEKENTVTMRIVVSANTISANG